MRTAVALLLPVALLAALVAGLLVLDPAARFQTAAPPVEDLAFERVELAPGVITLHVRNAAATANTVEQVLVDDAYWLFSMEPARTLDRYGAGVIRIEYPWVEGEAHVVKVLTSTGTVFEHEIPIAVETPQPTARTLADYALIGVLVGVVPVAAGMAFFPALRRLAESRYDALLALTLGVLAYLAIDTVAEGLELADGVPAAFHGTALFVGAALVAVLAVLGLERLVRGGPVTVALLVAVAIGLHNMGEGLLIGSAFALGSITLGSALIMGFALHNVTEGPAIVSPLSQGAGLPWGRFLLLAALAGIPTVLGAWLGAFASTTLLSVVFFGLGAGAILVVILQVAGQMRKDAPLLTPLNLGAFALGFLLMAATALLVAA